jgi:bifunctional non-homologous end joining protein LigD
MPRSPTRALQCPLLGKPRTGIQYSENLDGDGAAIFAHACKFDLEGIVSMHREHPCRSGPSKAWLKIKNPCGMPGGGTGG